MGKRRSICIRVSLLPRWVRVRLAGSGIGILLIMANSLTYAQDQSGRPIRLNLEEAVAMARSANKHVQLAGMKEDIAKQNIGIAKDNKIPDVNFHSSYSRNTNLTEFHNGWNPYIIEAIPDMYDFTFGMRMPVYAGNRINLQIDRTRQEAEIAGLRRQITANDIHIDVIATYLGIYKLQSIQEVILEQIAEEELRLREVQALKRNGAVTRNEVLRSELQLSNMNLSLISNRKNISIAIQDLKTLLNLDPRDSLVLDTLHLSDMEQLQRSYADYLDRAFQKEEVRLALREESLARTEKQELHGAYYPTVALYGSYAFKYPDYFLFPPTPYLYSLGIIGVELNFSLTNLYKNNKRIAIAARKISMQQLETDILKDEVMDKVHREYTQLQEIKERLPVTAKAIEQATENYRIVKNKYLNQLALITDMVDADNALLEARFNHISNKIDAQMKYYQLQYESGLLSP